MFWIGKLDTPQVYFAGVHVHAQTGWRMRHLHWPEKKIGAVFLVKTTRVCILINITGHGPWVTQLTSCFKMRCILALTWVIWLISMDWGMLMSHYDSCACDNREGTNPSTFLQLPPSTFPKKGMFYNILHSMDKTVSPCSQVLNAHAA